MKIGTVLRNEYVSSDSPLIYSVYIGIDGKYIHTIYPYNGKIERSKYYKEDVGEGKEIHPVGYTDVLKKMVDLMQSDLEEFEETESECDTEC